MRNECRVVVKDHAPFSPEPVEQDQKTTMFLVNVCPDEFGNRDVMSRLAFGPEPVAEHEAHRCFHHRLTRLLKTSCFVERKDSPRGPLPIEAGR